MLCEMDRARWCASGQNGPIDSWKANIGAAMPGASLGTDREGEQR